MESVISLVEGQAEELLSQWNYHY